MLPLLVAAVLLADVRDTISIRSIEYSGAAGKPVAAYLVAPLQSKGRAPGVLFVHWYEPPSPDSNRTQFLRQAEELARRGVTSLLIDTMWSDPEWFNKRNRADDYKSSVAQVNELRRALDVLATRKGVDPRRLVYVGHDFGAMYGAVLAATESKRVIAWVLQAGTTSFSDWFLLGTKLDAAGREAVVKELAPLDPVKHIGKAAGRPVLFQFATKDRFVSEAKAKEFFAAAAEPKSIVWYEAEHALNSKAVDDRMKWLIEDVLKLGRR